jgi:hypothetical protein
MPLRQLSKKYDLSEIFENTKIIEKIFISKGYITEEYKDYITLFVPGNLTKEDNEFIFAVRSDEKLPYDFKLKKIENIVKKLNVNDYETNSILNFDLLDYLIRNDYSVEIIKIIELLNEKDEEMLQFVDKFIEQYDSGIEFIELLIENSDKLWKKIYNKLGNKEYIDSWVMRFLLNEKSLNNIDENFKEYIKRHEDIDKYVADEEIDNVINSLKILKIKLDNIQKISNENFIEQIYLNELYELNITMIKLMLLLNNIELKEFGDKNLTIILTNNELKLLKNYVLNNFEEYYDSCYSLNNSCEDEEIAIIEIIQNEDISLDIRKKIIKNEKFNQYNIENINRELVDTIIDEDKLKVSYDNILSVFVKDNELKTNVVNNISAHIQEYKLEKIDDYNSKYSAEIVEQFKIMYIFDEDVLIEDFKILINTFDIKIKELKECSIDKIEYIIDNNLLEFNITNFQYIKENLNNKLIKFIITNIMTFVDNIDEYDISGYEDELLNYTEINKEHKIKIANYIDIEKLEDITLIELVVDNIISVNHSKINERILNNSSISIDNKLNLLKTILVNIDDKDKGTEYIHLLKNGYIDINTAKNACNIPYSQDNINLCSILKENDYISSYKIGKKKNIVIYNKVNRL